MKRVQWSMKSKVGELFLVADENHLLGVSWLQSQEPLISSLDDGTPSQQILAATSKQLHDFLDGHRRDFDLPLKLEGTDFQRKVWNQLRQIPFGKTCSYKDIAQGIHSPNAMRAVGGANGRNPICIIVPCHRVIAADGTIGGFSGGLEWKVKLLELEGRKFKSAQP